MLKMIVLGITIVVSQIIGALVCTRLLMNKDFIKKCAKTSMEATKELTEEMME